MGFCLTVRDGVLGENEEVEEGDEVGHDETRPRVLEIVAKASIYFHPAEPPSHTTPGSQRGREREKVLLLVRLHYYITDKSAGQIRAKPPQTEISGRNITEVLY